METQGNGDTTDDETSAEPDDQPDQQASRSRERRHQPDAYTVGYDPAGATRIGTGTADRGTRLRRLIRQNEGRHQSDGRHSTRAAARDKKRVTQAFCSVLSVTDHQQREAVGLMGRLNLDRFGQQKRLEKIALTVIRVVVDSDRHRLFFEGRGPAAIDLSDVEPSSYPTSIGDTQRYEELCAAHGFSDRDRFSVIRLVKDELRQIGYFDETTDGEAEQVETGND